MKQESPVEELRKPKNIWNQIFDYVGWAALIVYCVSSLILLFSLFSQKVTSSAFLRDNYAERINIVSLWLEIIAVFVSNNSRKRIISCLDWLDEKTIALAKQVGGISADMGDLKENYKNLSKVVESIDKKPEQNKAKAAEKEIKKYITQTKQEEDRCSTLLQIKKYIDQVKKGLEDYHRKQNVYDAFMTDVYFELVKNAEVAVKYYKQAVGDILTGTELRHCNYIKFLLSDYYEMYKVLETREVGINKLYEAIKYLTEMSTKLNSELRSLETS